MDPNSPNSEATETTEAEDAAVVAEQTSSPDVTEGAPSSGAEAKDQDAGAIIRDAFLKEYGDPAEADVEETTEASGEDADPPEAERKKAPEDKTDEGEDENRLSDDEFKALPDRARRRIGELNTKAKKLERQFQELSAQVDVGKQAIERMNEIERFVQENGIEPKNMAGAMVMSAKFAQRDYEGFLNDVMPFVEHARQALGKSLPADVQSKVDEGYLTEDAARELVQARMARQHAEAEAQALRARTEHQQRQSEQSAVMQSISQAVSAREAEIMSSDPDYAHIANAVKEQFRYALEMGARPRTPEEGVMMVNRAYEMAKRSVAATKPSPTATPKRPTASTVSRGTRTPASVQDAIISALAVG